jgi:hypothetical protein
VTLLAEQPLRVMSAIFAMSATSPGLPPTPERLLPGGEPTLRAKYGRCVANSSLDRRAGRQIKAL